jgi:arsenate reductase
MHTVLFVCVHNAGRSQMAEAYLNYRAEKEHLPVRAESAGTVGGTTINPVAAQVMEEMGISMASHSPKLLTQPMADSAGRIITMGCGVDAAACPARILVTEDWGLDDPKGQPLETVRAIRDQIIAHCDALLEELTEKGVPLHDA